MRKALFILPVLVCAVFSVAATAMLSIHIFTEPPSRLQPPQPVPAFEVTDHTGNTFTRDDMLGKVWVCDFFLTRCNGMCPILGLTMAGLSDELSRDSAMDNVKLVSFSVDPDHDTVAQLAQYRQMNMAAWARGSDTRQAEVDRRWVHARASDRDAFWEVVGEGGFDLYVGESPNDPTTPVAHSGRLVLIDRQGNIRGYYDGLTDEHMPALLADIRRLVQATD